jgi:hypothetical protein
MAECYKLTSAVPAEGEGGATPLQSITMIKYTNLVQQVRAALGPGHAVAHAISTAAISTYQICIIIACPCS